MEERSARARLHDAITPRVHGQFAVTTATVLPYKEAFFALLNDYIQWFINWVSGNLSNANPTFSQFSDEFCLCCTAEVVWHSDCVASWVDSNITPLPGVTKAKTKDLELREPRPHLSFGIKYEN